MRDDCMNLHSAKRLMQGNEFRNDFSGREGILVILNGLGILYEAVTSCISVSITGLMCRHRTFETP
jgi:hypothetical protein